jgi:hypothetical protein
MRKMLGRRPFGIWIALASLTLCISLGGGGQTLSVARWDLAVRLGLQEDRLDAADLVERTLAHVEWGTAGADVAVVVPLLLAGLLGVVLRRRWGMLAAMMAATCWLYMGAAFGLQRYSIAVRAGLRPMQHYVGPLVAFAVLVCLPCALIIWGLGANADRFRAYPQGSHRLRRKGELEAGWLENLLRCSVQVLRAAGTALVRGATSWNLQPGEAARELAGDSLVRGGRALDRAITIRRPPGEVWPWLARIGRGAGFYSWDFLDNGGHTHADYLVDAPEPRVGDWCKVLGTIRMVEPGREIVWYDETPFMGSALKLAMDFRVDPSGDGSSRVHYRMTGWTPDTLAGRLALRLGSFMDHVMSSEMLQRLALLCETYEERLAGGETNRDRAPHQRDPWRPAPEQEREP